MTPSYRICGLNFGTEGESGYLTCRKKLHKTLPRVQGYAKILAKYKINTSMTHECHSHTAKSSRTYKGKLKKKYQELRSQGRVDEKNCPKRHRRRPIRRPASVQC